MSPAQCRCVVLVPGLDIFLCFNFDLGHVDAKTQSDTHAVVADALAASIFNSSQCCQLGNSGSFEDSSYARYDAEPARCSSTRTSTYPAAPVTTAFFPSRRPMLNTRFLNIEVVGVQEWYQSLGGR